MISSYIEPVLGWTETLSAGGGMFYAVMLGLSHYLYMLKKSKFCIVPVDFVSNLILCAIVHTARCPEGTLNVVHATSSNSNGIQMDRLVKIAADYVKYNPIHKQINDPHIMIVSN